ncbi:hypothetical protein NPX13_g2972 [Xylaria arbuscula]|uniref:2-oxoadipate dioxygenase/decarboxylase n=1 Tax=Xylaria arbuscula TaxID=114810 RepID=A0A9W8NJ27_9PEZI|nr:hypothetical protein NPX13_g2972 [Xylaria arbuscula]
MLSNTMSLASHSMYADKDDLRTQFAAAMSAMYRAEVPLYGDLIEIVRNINTNVKDVTGSIKPHLNSGIHASIERLTQERHGAIRLGTPYELRTVKRIFEALGMHPIGYYDLSIAGLPMHATCFRPLTVSSLECNPFRIFTTLLRPELLSSEKTRQLALQLLERRSIFSEQLLRTLDQIDEQGSRLKEDQTEVFIHEALKTFQWQPVAAATFDEYQTLKAEHPILADIACFQSAHINHLTPRTLDIVAVQDAMKKAGMAAKEQIEGPPVRLCPILLRQTSFLALEEAVQFRRDENQSLDEIESRDALVKASHKARFGEIEQRGAAVTPKGRKLYDKLLYESKAKAKDTAGEEADALAAEAFKAYPDTWDELRQQNLIYCEFKVKEPTTTPSFDVQDGSVLEQLISKGIVEAVPITYEDFLPLSAAGIFQSNLQSSNSSSLATSYQPAEDLGGLEKAMGAEILDLNSWYMSVQQRSLEEVGVRLGLMLEELSPANV